MNLNDTEKESNCTCAAVSWSSQSRCGMVVHGREWETQNASICFRKRARALITSASLSFLSMLISLGADLNVVVWVLFFSFFFFSAFIFCVSNTTTALTICSALLNIYSECFRSLVLTVVMGSTKRRTFHLSFTSYGCFYYYIEYSIYIYIHMYRLGIHYV